MSASSTVTLSFLICYLVAALLLPPDWLPLVSHLGSLVWLFLLYNLANFAGTLKMPIFIASLVLVAIGFIRKKIRETRKSIEKQAVSSDENQNNGSNSVLGYCRSTLQLIYSLWYQIKGDDANHEITDAEVTQDNEQSQSEPISLRSKAHLTVARFKEENSFSYYVFCGLFWCYSMILFTTHRSIFVIFGILVAVIAIRRIILFLCLHSYCRTVCANLLEFTGGYASGDRIATLVPTPLRKLVKYLKKGGCYVVDMLYDSMDECCSIVVILAMLVLLFVGAVFVVVQLNHESYVCARIITNLYNQSEIVETFISPDSADRSSLQLSSIVDNVYTYSKSFVSEKADEILANVPRDSRRKMKQELMALIDKSFSYWMNSSGGEESWSMMTSSGGWWPWSGGDLGSERLSWYDWINLAKSNVEQLRALLVNIWDLVRVNVSHLYAILHTLVSLVLTSGVALASFFFDCLIFLTMLYYLLAESRDLYKPVDWLAAFFGDYYGHIVGKSLSKSVRGVFMAASKMFVFYGVYTWCLHRVFMIDIAFLPSLVASILAIIPLVGVYAISIPGCVQLWLERDHFGLALLFFALHFAPTVIVDGMFYAEIKGAGHPYLTALAIVGGAYCFGIEGAILGPVLLCVLVAAADLYRELTATPSQTTSKFSSSFDES